MSIWAWHSEQWHKVPLLNSARGKLVYVVCNGPSLNKVPVEQLRGPGRVVIGVNNTYPFIRPDYWIGMDTPDCYDAGLFHDTFPKLVRGNYGDLPFNGSSLKEAVNTWFVDVNRTKLWDPDGFAWHKNTLSVALQTAVYLGARTIALVGVDLDNRQMHYADGNYLRPENAAANQRIHEEQLSFLKDFVQQVRQLGISLESASPGSRINAFLPFTSVEDRAAATELSFPRGRATVHCDDNHPARIALVCRSGGDFAPEHVSWFLSQLPPTIPKVVLTDFPQSEFNVPVTKLQYGWPGWWSKMELFSPDVLGDAPLLYFDLDTVIRDWNPEWLNHGSSLMLTDFLFPEQGASGVMLIQPKDGAVVWRNWLRSPERWMKEHLGDQDFIGSRFAAGRWQEEFPDQFSSFKVHAPVLGRCVCFHGNPRPWQVSEDWIPGLAKRGAVK